MGLKSMLETIVRGGSKDNIKNVAESASVKKYLYTLPTAKYFKGLELIYREQENFYWFQDNIDYLKQFYGSWYKKPTTIETMRDNSGYNSWYEWTVDKGDILTVHAPVASFITLMMDNLVFSGPIEIKINNNEALNERLQKAFGPNENDIQNFLRKADLMESVGGTIMFKCNYDKEISDYPILEYYEVNKIDYMEKFGRITDMLTVDTLKKNDLEYNLVGDYNHKGITYKLFRDGNEVDMNDFYDEDSLSKPENYYYLDKNGNQTFGPILGVWKMRNLLSHEFYDMKLGSSDYEGIIDSFQMCDEIYSRFISQIRATQPVLFMSEELMGYKRDSSGNNVINKPKDLGCKIYELSGGMSIVDGKSIAAMFNRDVPDLTGVDVLASSFEWVLRQILNLKGMAPSSGNMDTKSVGSNTTGSSLFKREQSTHLVRKNLINGWTTAIKGLVRLICQYFDIMDSDGQKIPNDYNDLDIDVMFPDIDMDDFDTRLSESVKGFVAGLFSIKEGVKHAFKNKMSEDDMNKMIAELEEKEQKNLEAKKANDTTDKETFASEDKATAQKTDAMSKINKIQNQNSKK